MSQMPAPGWGDDRERYSPAMTRRWSHRPGL